MCSTRLYNFVSHESLGIFRIIAASPSTLNGLIHRGAETSWPISSDINSARTCLCRFKNFPLPFASCAPFGECQAFEIREMYPPLVEPLLQSVYPESASETLKPACPVVGIDCRNGHLFPVPSDETLIFQPLRERANSYCIPAIAGFAGAGFANFAASILTFACTSVRSVVDLSVCPSCDPMKGNLHSSDFTIIAVIDLTGNFADQRVRVMH